jgi:hypothetical protein
MKNPIVAAIFLVSMARPVWAAEEATTSPPLRQIVDRVVIDGSAIVHNGNSTIRLVRLVTLAGAITDVAIVIRRAQLEVLASSHHGTIKFPRERHA